MIAKRNSFLRRPVPNPQPLILIIHGLQLPQNVGALLRTAEGAGVSEVFITTGSADPFSPKSLRGSSGSAFRLPIRTGAVLSELAPACRKRNIALVAATQKGRTDYHHFDWRQPSGLIVGSEGAGLSLADLSLVDTTVRIPMQGEVESLNVGVAGAVCLFEAARQRSVNGA